MENKEKRIKKKEKIQKAKKKKQGKRTNSWKMVKRERKKLYKVKDKNKGETS